MTKTFRSLVAATAGTAALSLITLAAASPSAAPARAATASAQASTALPGWPHGWSGYVAVAPKGKTITEVLTHFTVPKALPQNSVGARLPYQAVMWAGMDGSQFGGYGGVEQAGVWEQSWGKKAAPQYLLFWEMYPEAPHFIWNAHVKPGDRVDIDVLAPGEYYHDGKFHFILRVNNDSTYMPSAFLAKGAVNAQHTAEVITEVPGSIKFGPAAALDMGHVHYTWADYLLSGKDPMPNGNRTVYPVTQHKIWALYQYKYTPLQEAWVTSSNPLASLPSYGSAWKTDSFTTDYHHIGS
jgi:hypothetical protein